MTVLRVAAKQHPVAMRVAWVVAKGAASYARYFLSCSVYREQIIVVFRVTVSLPDWKCSPFLTDFLVSFVGYAFDCQTKTAANRVHSAFRLGNSTCTCVLIRTLRLLNQTQGAESVLRSLQSFSWSRNSPFMECECLSYVLEEPAIGSLFFQNSV
jgi:hypothetical protein